MLSRSSEIGFVCLVVLGSLFATHNSAWAQLPATRLDWIYPAGSSPGATLEVTVGGADLDELNQLQFSHPGIVARPKMTEASEFVPAAVIPNTFIVDVAPEVASGVYEARVIGRFGVSNPKRFSIDVLAPIVEAGSNKSVDSAQSIELNSTVDGRAEANARDYFKLKLVAGQRVIVEALTDAVGSRMIATLEILDLEGREIDKVRGTSGFRSVLDFTAPADGVYVVSIYDFLFRGSPEYFYRLRIHGGPYVEWLEPSVIGGQEPADVAVVGRNLGEQAKAAGDQLRGQSLDRFVTQVVPQDPSTSDYAKWLMPVSGYPLKTIPYSVTTDAGTSTPLPLVVTELPVVRESETDSEQNELAQTVNAPCMISGRFAEPRDTDLYEFQATAGQVLWIELFAHRLGMPVDGFLVCQQVLAKEDGSIEYKTLQEVDDPGDRNAAIGSDFDLSTDDPGFRFQAPADGTYRLVLTDQFGGTRDDPRVRYLLRIRPESPGLELIVEPPLGRPGNGNQAVVGTLSLRKNGTEKLEVQVNRRDGFAGDVALRIEGLPEGVSAPPVTVSPSSGRATLVIHANENVTSWQGPIRVVGTYELNGQTVEQHAIVGTLVWGTPDRNQSVAVSRVTNELFASLVDVEVEPVTIHAVSPQGLMTSRGASFEIPIQVDRRLEFNAALNVNAVGLPGEIKPAGPVQVAENSSEGKLVLSLADGNVRPGPYRVVLVGDLVYKQVRNPQVIAAATERQQQIVTWTTEWQAKKEAAAKTMAELPARREQLEAARIAADVEAQKADQSLAQAAAQTAQTGQRLQDLRTQLAAEPTDPELQQNVAQAAAEYETQSTQLQQQLTSRQEAKAALAKTQSVLEGLAQMETEAQSVLAVADQKIARLAELKTQADAQLDAINKANQPVDRTYSVVSLPIDFVVEAAPYALNANPNEIQSGSEGAIIVDLERKYGFADVVQLTPQLATEVSGLTVEAVALPANQNQIGIVVKTTPDTPPGDYPVTIKATAKFNNVDVETTTTVTLKILPRA